MDGSGAASKVTKGGYVDKQRTKYMRQDRQFRTAFINDEGEYD
jgi:hypothetical protein